MVYKGGPMVYKDADHVNRWSMRIGTKWVEGFALVGVDYFRWLLHSGQMPLTTKLAVVIR